ncbi:hypothetical protein CDL15_Pgr009699 [Punica granatum]|uniref:Protein kinase domain-containing protein n=1 Tax=Punica granatum TaxID=22663 RepID=A0A218WT76_PUNGR|nr:hypothetical protein CDL15_Pgr009699 [Punica granatum]
MATRCFRVFPETRSIGRALFMITFAAFFASLNSVNSQAPVDKCILTVRLTPTNNQSCEDSTWGGFINPGCCGTVFSHYLYALGQRANLTGLIFLNSTEQKDCLVSIKSADKDGLECGIEKLTSGAGACSDYMVKDVDHRLGDSLRKLTGSCRLLGSRDKDNQTCSSCLTTWKEMGITPENGVEPGSGQAELCRFAVLVTLMSKRFGDTRWAGEVHKCLGDKQVLPIGKWILIGGLIGITVILLIAFSILCRKTVKNPKRSISKGQVNDKPSKTSLPRGKDVTAANNLIFEDGSGLRIRINEVYSATNNFHPSNFIGQGIAGKVFKGVLSDGQHVAVKHITSDGYMDTFVREITSLSDVRHPNLVALLGYCEKEDECFLVYELCHNGSLSDWLFGKDKSLSWIQRLEIAIDCAQGLWFLHTYPDGCIIHRDIKPTNILISENLQAKLSDFGLSKVIDAGQSFVSSEVRGTFGYVDPEYRRNHHVNASGDVYSFGIVLLQLLSGKRVINLNLAKPMPLNRMAKVLTKGGNIAEFADPKLKGEYLEEAFEAVLKLALSCTGLKQQRPSMKRVVSELEKALNISSSAVKSPEVEGK